jgi:hypothetical protein
MEKGLTKNQMVSKVKESMVSHGRDTSEISFEMANMADWWQACAGHDAPTLADTEKTMLERLSSAERSSDKGDVAYVECRRLFLDVFRHFQ